MMHTFRLLLMAEEIATQGKVIVRRSDRAFLLNIRNGQFEYDDLLEMACEKIDRMEELYQKSDLPDEPDAGKAEQLLVEVREEFYKNLA